jgi:hypothetical protein
LTITSLSDVNAAFEQGRHHTQRVLKNAGTATALQWADQTFASGQPAFDAHVGAAVTFTPCVATGNDAVYFPGKLAAEQRRLISATMWANQNGGFNGPASVYLFDLVGFYPLIDGDSTDAQDMNNTAALPRYTGGNGLIAVMVNHIAQCGITRRAPGAAGSGAD